MHLCSVCVWGDYRVFTLNWTVKGGKTICKIENFGGHNVYDCMSLEIEA